MDIEKWLKSERVKRQLATTACPQCESVGTLQPVSRLVARPLGTWSLAGAQMKASAIQAPALWCSNPECDFEEIAKGYRPKDMR